MAREIREESCRIQKEIELERKANRIKETTPKKSDRLRNSKKQSEDAQDGGISGSSTSQQSSPPATQNPTRNQIDKVNILCITTK